MNNSVNTFMAFKFNYTTHFRAMFRFWFPWKHPGGIEWPEMGSMMSVTSFWLTLNRFYRFFWCFHCWLWTSKYRLAYFRFLVRVGKKLKLGTLKILVKNIRRHSNKSTEISSNLCQSIDQYTVMSSVKIIKRVFTMWNFIPGWTHPCRWWNVSYCLHVFAEMKFHPGMKDRDEISFRDEKRKKDV